MKPAEWLQKFAGALQRGEIDAAAGMFEPDGFWRDLVAFTWNVKTCEGRAEVKAMLAARLSEVRPRGFALRGTSTSNNGVHEAWFTFETAVGRGIGHLRLRGKYCWTLLTTLQELRGYEEKAGVHREAAVAKDWLEKRQQEAAELGVLRQPYVLIVGGGQG